MDNAYPLPVHVCLVSSNLLPNLIPVLMDRPAQVHLVVSHDMSLESRRLQRLLNDRQIPCVVHNSAPSTDLPALREYALNLAETLDSASPDQPIVLNATGGTKLMALAFVDIFRELLPNAAVIYTDTEHGRLEYLTKRECTARTMTHVLDIPTYLAAHGLTLRCSASDEAVWQERVQQRKALTKWLAQHTANLGDFLGAVNGMASQTLDQNGNLVNPVQTFATGEPHGRWRVAVEEIKCYGLIDWRGGTELAFCNADAAGYLGGLWLEEYAWHIVRDERPDDVKVNVEGTWEGSRSKPARNEFDLLAVHANRMLVVECKTLRFGNYEERDRDILHKLESLGRNTGGLFGRTLLLSARPLSEAARARAKSQRIEVIEADQLKELRTFVQNWMRGNVHHSAETGIKGR